MTDSEGVVTCRFCGLRLDLIGQDHGESHEKDCFRRGDVEAEGYYEKVAPKVGMGPEGTWEGVFAAGIMGWGLETPVGTVPMGPTDPDGVLDFIEELAKPWPKEDPRREGEGQ